MELDRPYAQLLRYRNELTTLLLNYARSPSPLSLTLSILAREKHRLSNVSLLSGFQRHPEGRGRRTREVLSWNIQPRGMQTEEPKRKPYDALEKVEGGSICLRALNALLEAGPRYIYTCICVREDRTVWLPQELSLYKVRVRLILQAGWRVGVKRREAPTGILGEIIRLTFHGGLGEVESYFASLRFSIKRFYTKYKKIARNSQVYRVFLNKCEKF